MASLSKGMQLWLWRFMLPVHRLYPQVDTDLENTESTGQWLPIVLFSKPAVITKCLGVHLGK